MTKGSGEVEHKNGVLLFVLIASIVWIAVCALLFSISDPCAVGASDFVSARVTCLSANEMGDFLAGAFAPLAFLWLIAAVFLQRDELIAQRSELRQSREIARQQFEESRKNVDYIRQQTEIMSEEHETDQLERDVRSALQPAYNAINTFESIARDVKVTHVFDTLTPFSRSEDRSQLRLLGGYIRQLEAFWAESVPMNGDNGPVEFSDTSAFLAMREDLSRVIDAVERLDDVRVIDPLTLPEIRRGIAALEGLHGLNDTTSPFWRHK